MEFFQPIQAHCVDAIKRHALRLLHRSTRGEQLLLTLYLWAEEGAEGTLLDEIIQQTELPWLLRQMERHTADELRHAGMLRARFAELGITDVAQARVDVLSQWKLRRLKALCNQSVSHFSAGAVVPVFALIFRMEAMGVRVMARHVSVMEQLEAEHGTQMPFLPLLKSILADERKHVGACESALARLVRDDEKPALAQLCARIDDADRAFGVTGALALWMSGVGLLMAQALQNAMPGQLRSVR